MILSAFVRVLCSRECSADGCSWRVGGSGADCGRWAARFVTCVWWPSRVAAFCLHISGSIASPPARHRSLSRKTLILGGPKFGLATKPPGLSPSLDEARGSDHPRQDECRPCYRSHALFRRIGLPKQPLDATNSFAMSRSRVELRLPAV
jgi:hypothetical protein